MAELLDRNQIDKAQQHIENIKTMSSSMFGKETGITFGEYFKRLWNDGKGKFNRLLDKFTDVGGNLQHDDNICVPLGQKTLLGQDFQSLFNRSATFKLTTMTTDEGYPKKYISADTGYDTNMYGGLSRPEPVEYSALAPDVKAAYEVTQLSKSYASEMGQGNDEALTQSYKAMMQSYQIACEDAGVPWEHVLNAVSNELQAENIAAKNRGDVSEFNAASNAHKMMLSAAPEGYKDSVSLAYAGQLSYEDMVNPNGDTSVDRSWKKNLGNLIQTGTAFASKVVGTAWNYCRSIASGLNDKIEFSGSNGMLSSAGAAATGFIGESKAPQWDANIAQSREDQAAALLPASDQSNDESYTM